MRPQFDYDGVEQRKAQLQQKALTLEAANAPPGAAESPHKKRLKRDVQAAALERVEQAARTDEDFRELVKRYDILDENKERKERYWEKRRDNEKFPLEYGEAAWGTVFPKRFNSVLAKQVRKGDFIDAIYNCPYEIHELVTAPYLSKILRDLKEEHKELLYLIAIRGLSTSQIAKLQGKSERAVRYMRQTMFDKIRKRAYAYLTSEQCEHSLTLYEKRLIERYNKIEKDNE